MKRSMIALGAAALVVVAAVPALASPGSSTTIEVPSWAWPIAASLLVAVGRWLIGLVASSIRKELEPVKALIPKVSEMDGRLIKAEERIDFLRGEVRV